MDHRLTISLRVHGMSHPGPALLSLPAGMPLVIGRIDAGAQDRERVLVPIQLPDCVRLPIAPVDLGVSRRQARIDLLSADTVRVTNLSGSIGITCVGYPEIAPGNSVEVPLPVHVQIASVAVSLSLTEESPEGVDDGFHSIESPVEKRDGVPVFQKQAVSSLLKTLPQPAANSLVSWWRSVIAVLQSASSSDDFFLKAAQAVVRLVGLDVGAVFLLENGGWRPAAIETSSPGTARPSTSVLRRVLEEKRTFYSRVDPEAGVFTSIASIDAYVAAPIFDRTDAVIGAVYGHRSRALADSASAEITHLEALLVQTLASGVAAGLARLAEEKASLARKVQFEQFFSPELAAQLDAQPDLLTGRDADVTVLFCDIRGFSGVSERLGPAQTMEWVGGVLGTLSDQVVATGGVLVDYIGDELMAMWGAPSPQPDHALLACQAARLMLERATDIDARWKHSIGAPTRFGIGVNSAPARVGNTGSSRKFKYGPLGTGVNLASRVQGATKYLKVPAIVTGSTRSMLDASFLTRRLCRVQVVNILEPVDLFELDCGTAPGARERFAQYEDALAAFDAGRFSTTAKILGDLLAAWPGDGPSLVLLARAVDCMINEPKVFSPVWQLPGK